VDLKGGTTGQVLTKASGTDLDFNFTTPLANPLTTTGDIIYSSSGSTLARLGIGTTGQVLNVTAGVPAWATPAAAAFNGVQLTKTQNMSSGATTNFTDFTENYDSASYYTGSGTDITVSTAGKYLVTFVLRYDPNATGYRSIAIGKNGNNDIISQDFGNATAQSFNGVYGIVNQAFTLAVNDTLRFRSYQDSGVTLSAQAAVTVQFLGA
jgi:hypothetical protein